MNMLCNKVPESLNISETDYEINTDFRVWIRFEERLSGNAEITMSDIKKLIFKSETPSSELDEETTEQILWFYRCGKPEKKGGSAKSKEVFSYDYDDGYICAAFMEQYHIDLNAEDLHWWKFHALMLSLSDSTEFVKIMGYRAIEINSKMTAAQKAFYQKMKKHHKLPIKKELQQKYSAIEEALINGESIDNLL